ncbi:MAG: RNA 2',3'-cyclic phosphodiesterase [Candidatus Pacebacteria bacterium]|nr:RNA 2',3'-cyclic phosphodiesterase [Candidatus Paceibacterota bacterium]
MRHRIFIASPLPDNVKKVLLDYQQEKLSNPCFRKVPQEALHLTLIFIGYVSDSDLLKIIEVSKNSINSSSPAKVQLNRIGGGPNPHSPRLIWAEGKASNELNKLHKTLEQGLINQGINFKTENRLFKPHITLARIKQDNNFTLPPLGEIEIKINESFIINQISIIRSKLMPHGPKYTTIKSFDF